MPAFVVTNACRPCQLREMRQVGSLDLSVTRTYDKEGRNTAASTVDEIQYVYEIMNNGLLTLYDISIEAHALVVNKGLINCTDTRGYFFDAPMFGSVDGLAAYPSMGLAPATSLVCTASDGISRAEVRGADMRLYSGWVGVAFLVAHDVFTQMTSTCTQHKNG